MDSITCKLSINYPGFTVADPPGPEKISNEKDGRQRRPHRFHVSRPLHRPLDPLLLHYKQISGIISSRQKMTMNFHDSDKLQCTLYSHCMGTSKPRCLAQWLATGLLFEDLSTTPTRVHAYNLDSKGPAQKPSILIAKIPQEDYITDMCFVKQGAKSLLITSHYYSGGIFAYSTKPSSEA